MYIIVDCNYICHRAKHSVGHLEFKGIQTGVAYGFLCEMLHLMEFHRSRNLVFCWDYGKNKRKEIYPGYKKRDPMTEEEIEERKDFQRQQKLLREEYLPAVGFKNIFYQWGYEADDMIAAFAESVQIENEGVIISSDKDLLQCISPNVSFNAPGKPCLSYQGFYREYGIMPSDWAKVKALAGCLSDKIEGIKGVGEKTALKYLKKELNTKSKVYKRIISHEGKHIRKRNYRLVKLPFRGTRLPSLQKDELSLDKWNEVIVKRLGMRSLRTMGI